MIKKRMPPTFHGAEKKERVIDTSPYRVCARVRSVDRHKVVWSTPSSDWAKAIAALKMGVDDYNPYWESFLPPTFRRPL